MKKKLFVTVVLCWSVANGFAQQKNNKPAFHSQEQVAMINGNGAVSAGIQSVNGFAYNQWFAGIGVGLDFYRYRSVPLFVDVKRYFNIRNGNAFFIYGDGGYNIPWTKEQNEQYSIWGWASKTETKYKGGAYMDAGAGYAVRFRKGNALLLSVGFSHKYFSEKRTTTTWNGGVIADDTGTENVQQYTYNFNRIMVKMGWQF